MKPLRVHKAGLKSYIADASVRCPRFRDLCKRQVYNKWIVKLRSSCFEGGSEFKLLRSSSVWSAGVSVRGLFHNSHQSFEVVGHCLEGQFQLILGPAQIPNPPITLPLLEMAKDAFVVSPHPAFALVGGMVCGGEFDMIAAFLLNVTADAAFPQPRLVSQRIVSLIGINPVAVLRYNRTKNPVIRDFGRANNGPSNQLMFPIATDMGLKTIITARMLAGIAGLGIVIMVLRPKS